MVHACGARTSSVRTGAELRAVLAGGLALRSTLETQANPISSRSHAICTLRFGAAAGGGAAGGGAASATLALLLLLLAPGPVCMCACLLLVSSRRQRDRARAGAAALLDRCGVGGGSSARFGEAQEKRPLTEEAEAGAEPEAEADTEAATGAATRAGAGAGFDAGGGGAAAHVREALRRAVGGEGCASNLPATSSCLATPRYLATSPHQATRETHAS